MSPVCVCVCVCVCVVMGLLLPASWAALQVGLAFPLGEAFHLIWGIDAGAGPQRFVLYMVPPKAYLQDGTSHTRAHLCRLTHGTCEPISRGGSTFARHGDSPYRCRGRYPVACPGSGGTTHSWPTPHGTCGHVLSPRPLDVLERPAAYREPARYHRLGIQYGSGDVRGPPRAADTNKRRSIYSSL